MPELEDALLADGLDGGALLRVEAAIRVGARDTACELLGRVVRQEEPEDFLGTLVI